MEQKTEKIHRAAKKRTEDPKPQFKLMKMPTRYEEVGVDAKKKGIEVFKSSIKNLFPSAFCTISRDPDLENHGIILHTDGAGSKPIQNYLHWKKTEDPSWFQSIAQDVMAMNLDDIISIGASPIAFVDYVALNKTVLPKKEVLSHLNKGFSQIFELLKEFDMNISFLGGETADLPDQMRTLDVSGTIFGRAEIPKIVTGEKIEPGNLIVGLRSGGKTNYEEKKNSGLMCNGITLARHSLMSENYTKKNPELSDSQKNYFGRFAFDKYLDELRMTAGEAIISPTRIFAPVLKKVLDEIRGEITGIVHNTGGGMTKSLNIGKNIHYVKDDLIKPEPIFRLIQRESGEKWKAMFEDFNMGTGFEIMVKESHAEEILKIAKRFDLGAKIIGECKRADRENKVTIKSEFGKFKYMEGV